MAEQLVVVMECRIALSLRLLLRFVGKRRKGFGWYTAVWGKADPIRRTLRSQLNGSHRWYGNLIGSVGKATKHCTLERKYEL